MSTPQYVQRDYSGGAPPALLVSPMGATDLSFSIPTATAAEWVNAQNAAIGTKGPFVVAIDAGASSVEKILCSALTPSTGLVTVWSSGGSNGRGYDGTQGQGHVAGTTLSVPQGIVQVVWSAEEATEANQLVSQLLGAAASGSIGQIPVVSSTSPPQFSLVAGPQTLQHSAATMSADVIQNPTGLGPVPYNTLGSGSLGGPGAAYGWDTTNYWYTVPVTGMYACVANAGVTLTSSGTVTFRLLANTIPAALNDALTFPTGGPSLLTIPHLFLAAEGTQIQPQIGNNTSGIITISSNFARTSIAFAFLGSL